jgi:hypothetical protein
MKKFAGAAFACATGLVLATPAEAVVIGSGSDSLYRALAANFASVGQIYGTDSTGGFAASGVVIASNWVLTAGHVTSGATSLSFFLDGGGDFSSFATRTGIAATNWLTNSGYNGNLNSGYDIGLIHFDTNFTTAYGIAPRRAVHGNRRGRESRHHGRLWSDRHRRHRRRDVRWS